MPLTFFIAEKYLIPKFGNLYHIQAFLKKAFVYTKLK